MKNVRNLIICISLLLFFSCGEDIPDATCNDGILNGNEVGLDCGGECTACPTCDDGEINGDETGVDCGGSCIACPTCFDGVQNGLETGIDCGGNCDDCTTPLDELLGIWEVQVFLVNGADVLAVFNIQNIYYDFMSGGSYNTLTESSSGSISLNTYSYSLSQDGSKLTTNVNGEVSEMDADFNNEFGVLYGFSGGDETYFEMTKVTADLCDGVVCSTGQCIYGYCL